MQYRYEHAATVNFTVEADNEEEANRKAVAIVRSIEENGFNVNDTDADSPDNVNFQIAGCNIDAHVHVSPEIEELAIIDILDDDEADETDPSDPSEEELEAAGE